MELKYQNVEDIQVDSPLVGKVYFKQKTAPIICIVFGIAVLFVSGIWTKILGVFFLAMAIFVIKFVEDKPTMDVYESGVVIYRPDNEKLAFYLAYEDVQQWKVSRDSGHDSIIFEFTDGQKTGVDTFQLEKAYQYLIKACPSREEREIQKEKNKKMKWANPIETLRNLGKSFTKKK